MAQTIHTRTRKVIDKQACKECENYSQSEILGPVKIKPKSLLLSSPIYSMLISPQVTLISICLSLRKAPHLTHFMLTIWPLFMTGLSHIVVFPADTDDSIVKDCPSSLPLHANWLALQSLLCGNVSAKSHYKKTCKHYLCILTNIYILSYSPQSKV